MRYFGLLLLLCSLPLSALSQWMPPVPSNCYPYTFEGNLPSDDYLLITPFKLFTTQANPSYHSPKPLLLDNTGAIAWMGDESIVNSLIDFKYYPDQQQYSYSITQNQITRVVLLDNQFAILDTLAAINGNFDVHDVQRAANGNWLFTTEYFDTVDLSAYQFGPVYGNDTTILLGFGWQEVDPSGNLVFEWNSNDHVDPLAFYNFYGYNDDPFDYCHGNAIEEDDDGNILLSFRHLNAVYKINRTNGSVIWELGGQNSDFTFINTNGFSGQHDIRKLTNGHYSLFNNANMMAAPKISRGMEFALDTVNWTATLINEVIHPDAFFARAMGNFQQSANGQSTICYGLDYRPDPSATVFDAAEQPIAQLFLSDSVVSYRCHNVTGIQLQRPEITCAQNGNYWELSAVNSYNSYLWSTGETAASIQVTQPGDYQLWVPAASGYYGSLVVHVTDVSNPCSLGLEELLGTQLNGDYDIVDLLGRPVLNPQPGTVYLKIYRNGLTEKCISLTE